MTNFGYYKTTPEAIPPQYSTDHAACFDLCACLLPGNELVGYNRFNEKIWNERHIGQDQTVTLFPRDRMLIPTGLVFSIPDGYSIRIHPRSGLSLKSGIQLSNCEGIIDSDYTLETFISIINGADIPFKVAHGDRIAQAELVRDTRAVFTEVFEKPTKDSNRTGGFGSTGLGQYKNE